MAKPLKRPPPEVVDACFQPWEVENEPIRDTGLTCVTRAETQNSLRLPRLGLHETSLVAVRRYYDGTNGGTAGEYVALWTELRYQGQRWKTPTLKIRAEEAGRVAKDMLARKPSAPRKGEEPRTSGRDGTTRDSSLLGLPVGKNGYLLYVRSGGGANNGWVRTRGVEIRMSEAGIVSELLRQIAEAK